MGRQNDYPERVGRAVDYIQAHLDESLDLERLAHVACFSAYHFHRVFRAVRGETVADAVRRLRLRRAALDLLERETPIERIARRAGYTSQAAFTRAFRSAYGQPPGRFQEGPGLASPRLTKGDPHMYDVKIAETPRIYTAALAHSGDYQSIGATFERLLALGTKCGIMRPDSRSFGLYYDDPAAVPVDKLRAHACLAVDDGWSPPPGDLKPLAIAAGRFATIIHLGPYGNLPSAYEWLFRDWLVGSTKEAADAPCVEEYLNSPGEVPAKDLRTAVWLPLK
jgi:AraC family transcriptional regulator